MSQRRPPPLPGQIFLGVGRRFCWARSVLCADGASLTAFVAFKTTGPATLQSLAEGQGPGVGKAGLERGEADRRTDGQAEVEPSIKHRGRKRGGRHPCQGWMA